VVEYLKSIWNVSGSKLSQAVWKDILVSANHAGQYMSRTYK
jgi:hypothetical protein